jgi:superfamily II DNA/RNA helicase
MPPATIDPRAPRRAPDRTNQFRNRPPRADGAVASRTAPPTAAKAATTAVTRRTSNEPAVDASAFAALGVHHAQVRVLEQLGVTTPFPIQQVTLPDSLAGCDVLGRGRTGSGKTIAFTLPTVHRLAAQRQQRRHGAPRALVLVPTRELANQVAETFAPFVKAAGLRVAVIFGGVSQGPQVAALKSGIDIVIACPGRLEDLVQQGHCRLDHVEVTVLDEADHMADMGFLPGVKRLLDRTPRDAQRLLFSATLDNGVDVLVQRYMSNPVIHHADAVEQPVAITHHVVNVTAADKLAVVTRLAAGEQRSLLFTRTKHGAKKLVKQLAANGVGAVELHGNLSQNARERNLAAFAAGEITTLVATDIAARGVHVDEVGLVVHVDPPAEHKAFVHRSGRTARAGASGVVVTIATADQASEVRQLARLAKITPTVTSVDPRHPLLAELAGPAMPARPIAPRPV